MQEIRSGSPKMNLVKYVHFRFLSLTPRYNISTDKSNLARSGDLKFCSKKFFKNKILLCSSDATKSAPSIMQASNEQPLLAQNNAKARTTGARAAYGARDAEASRRAHQKYLAPQHSGSLELAESTPATDQGKVAFHSSAPLVEESTPADNAFPSASQPSRASRVSGWFPNVVGGNAADHPENTLEEGEFVRPAVFGGLDGISTSFSLLTAAIGMKLSLMNLVGISVAQVLAGAFGMAFGEYMSSKAERQIALREKNREAWEVENFPEGGIIIRTGRLCGGRNLC